MTETETIAIEIVRNCDSDNNRELVRDIADVLSKNTGIKSYQVKLLNESGKILGLRNSLSDEALRRLFDD